MRIKHSIQSFVVQMFIGLYKIDGRMEVLPQFLEVFLNGSISVYGAKVGEVKGVGL